jgi:hypothetical protein
MIEHITPEDIRRVSNKYLQNESRVIVRETPTLTFTQFFGGLSVLIVGVPGAGVYLLRRLVKSHRFSKRPAAQQQSVSDKI